MRARSLPHVLRLLAGLLVAACGVDVGTGFAEPDAGCTGPSCRAVDAGTEPEAATVDGGEAGAPPMVCDVKTFGAVGDGKAKDTRAIQAAIDACAASPSGGVVKLHDGTFLSGTVRLASNMVLDIAATATLLGSQNPADYPDQNPPFQSSQLGNCKRALVYAEGATHVRIEGGGTIAGNARGVPDWNGNKIKEALRPLAVFVAGGTDVTVQNLTVKDAATWAVVVMEVTHAAIRKLTVSTDLGPTHDGIDVVDGRDVVVEDCNVTSGDDSICLKSGSVRGLHDVVVRRCQTNQSGVANGVKLGTASVGAFENIVVEDVAIRNAQSAAMAVESVDGALVSNVTFRRITVDNTGTPFFVLLGSRDRDPTRVGRIDGLAFENITGRNLRYAWGSLVTGTKIGNTTFGISNIAFRNIDIAFKGSGVPANPAPFTDDNFPEYQGPVPGRAGQFYNQYPDAKFIAGTGGGENIAYHAPGWGFFLRHASNVSFQNCKVTVSPGDPRPWLDTKDTAAVTGTCGP
jgi:polygalacturonase